MELRETAADDVATEHRNGPREPRAREHVDVGVERSARRRQPEQQRAAEVELHHRARRHAARVRERERDAQEARVEDRDARRESEFRALREHV